MDILFLQLSQMLKKFCMERQQTNTKPVKLIMNKTIRISGEKLIDC